MQTKINPGLRKCVPDSASWPQQVAAEARGLLAQLGGAGWGFADIAAALDCGTRSLYTWRIGGADMPACKLLALRALVAENCKKAVGQ